MPNRRFGISITTVQLNTLLGDRRHPVPTVSWSENPLYLPPGSSSDVPKGRRRSPVRMED